MRPPKDFQDKLDEWVAKKEKEKIKEKLREKKKADKNKKLEEFREENQLSLSLVALTIDDWRMEFLASEAARTIFRYREFVEIFAGSFQEGRSSFSDGKRIEQGSGCVGEFHLSKDGTLSYHERFKYFPGRVVAEFPEPYDPIDLVNKLHPDCLRALYDAIRSGDVWKFIANDLKRY